MKPALFVCAEFAHEWFRWDFGSLRPRLSHILVKYYEYPIDLLFRLSYTFDETKGICANSPISMEERMETYATVKGQIVIPSSVRRKFGIKEGTRIQVEIDEANHAIILKPITREFVRSLRGKYKDLDLMSILAEDKKREREL